jgi:hypothetical protein
MPKVVKILREKDGQSESKDGEDVNVQCEQRSVGGTDRGETNAERRWDLQHAVEH